MYTSNGFNFYSYSPFFSFLSNYPSEREEKENTFLFHEEKQEQRHPNGIDEFPQGVDPKEIFGCHEDFPQRPEDFPEQNMDDAEKTTNTNAANNTHNLKNLIPTLFKKNESISCKELLFRVEEFFEENSSLEVKKMTYLGNNIRNIAERLCRGKRKKLKRSRYGGRVKYSKISY